MLNVMNSRSFRNMNSRIRKNNAPNEYNEIMHMAQGVESQKKAVKEIPLVYKNLNENTKELLIYFSTTTERPASQSLIAAIEAFRKYAKGKSDIQIIREIVQYTNLPFQTPGPSDSVDMYAFQDPRVKVPNSLKNQQLITYLCSSLNYKSAEHFLYQGTSWGLRNSNE